MSGWFTHRVRVLVALLASMALVAGCGGDRGEATTTSEAETATTSGETPTNAEPDTTAAPATTSAPPTTTSGGVGVDDIPESCREVIRAVLALYEPHVSAIDWETATIQDHIDVSLALAGSDTSAIPDPTRCESEAAGFDFAGTSEEGAAMFLAIAEQDAPGAVSYFTVVLEAQESVRDRESTGDCRSDVATFEQIVAGGTPFMELPLGEQLLVLSLMGSIGFCSLQTQGELMFRPETQAFLAGSPFAGE